MVSRLVKMTISGRVQRVGYRRWVQKIAMKYNISGSVKNEDNGDVTVIAYAEDDKIQKLIKECYRGPLLARVDNIAIKEVAENGKIEELGFRIIF